MSLCSLKISGAANTLGTSSSSSQPAALICSAMLHLTSTAAVLNALIAARQLAAASHATDPPLGLQGPSMNQGPAESEALLAAPAAAAGPSTSFAEELQPAAPDPEFSAVSSTRQLLHRTGFVTTCIDQPRLTRKGASVGSPATSPSLAQPFFPCRHPPLRMVAAVQPWIHADLPAGGLCRSAGLLHCCPASCPGRLTIRVG